MIISFIDFSVLLTKASRVEHSNSGKKSFDSILATESALALDIAFNCVDYGVF